ncbi:MAG: hypothetical protein ACU0BO_13720 [Limimaricola soesokkakensis]|uniref:hypothetical protein n=1 Tax=Limimaricola soesokkakensis TaxID=1343159 RepID=UPI004057CDB1
MEPALTIIELCGGFKAVAEMTGRDETRVRRWTYPKDRGGTGGLIPSDMARILMVEAAKRGLPLKPEHFFPDVNGHKPPSGAAA